MKTYRRAASATLVVAIAVAFVANFLAFVADGNPTQANLRALAGKKSGGGGGPGPQQETFEPNPGYDLAAWNTTSGTPDPDYTGVTMTGAECLRLEPNEATEIDFGDADNIYLYFQVYVETWDSFSRLVGLRDSALNTRGTFDLRSSGTGQFRISHGSVNSANAGGHSDDTLYHVWFEHERGTGADGVARAYIATTATKPGTPTLEITTGNAPDAQISIFRFNAQGGGENLIDNVEYSTTAPIGSDPF